MESILLPLFLPSYPLTLFHQICPPYRSPPAVQELAALLPVFLFSVSLERLTGLLSHSPYLALDPAAPRRLFIFRTRTVFSTRTFLTRLCSTSYFHMNTGLCLTMSRLDPAAPRRLFIFHTDDGCRGKNCFFTVFNLLFSF